MKLVSSRILLLTAICFALAGLNFVVCLQLAEAGAWSPAPPIKVSCCGTTITPLRDGRFLVVGYPPPGVSVYLSLSAAVYDPVTNSWTLTNPMQQGRRDATATLLADGRVLITGGNSGISSNILSAEIYDPISNSWSAAGSMASAHTNTKTLLLTDGRVMIVDYISEIYDPFLNTWTSAGSMNVNRRDYYGTAYAATALPSGRVLVAGGPYSDTASSAEVYSPAINSWRVIAPMNQGRYVPTATALADGRVLVTGGRLDSNYLSLAEVYDFTADRWTFVTSMSSARIYHSSTVMNDGRVLVVGGYKGTQYISNTEIFDPSNNTWRSGGTIGNAASGTAALTTLTDGRVVAVLTGVSDEALSNIEVYDPAATNNWSTAASMTTSRHGHAATLLPDGRVFVFGGNDDPDISTGEIYDPATNHWSQTLSAAIRRSGSTPTLLSDGRVLIAGGIRCCSIVPYTEEIYDPSTNRWTAAALMNEYRAGHTATLLSDGRVLVAGGYHSFWANFTPLASAEIYSPYTNRWSPVSAMSTGRSGHGAKLLADGRVLVIGGSNYFTFDGSLDSTTEIYDPLTNAWSPGPPLSRGRTGETLDKLPDGRMIVVGGWVEPAQSNASAQAPENSVIIIDTGLPSLSVTNTTDIYDSTINAWSFGGSMTRARVSHTATRLVDGRLLVVGGGSGRNLFNAETYDPGTNGWSFAGYANLSRSSHTATLLPDGRVLVTGGYVDGYNQTEKTSTAEIFSLKETPMITWTTPANIVYGTPLGPAQLNATASVPGTFVYTPAAGAVLDGGDDQLLSAVFYPQDSARYSPAPVTVTINVSKANPTIAIYGAGEVFIYDGKPHSVTGYAYGVGGSTDILIPALSFTYFDSPSNWNSFYTPPIAVGKYRVYAYFPGNRNYSSANTAAIEFTIHGAEFTPPEAIITGPLFTAPDSFTFTWTGVDNVTPASDLQYAYRLDPWDLDFTLFGKTTSASYRQMSNGSYAFYVKALDSAGNEQMVPTTSSFAVNAPLPTVSINDVSQGEGNWGLQLFLFTVSLSEASTRWVWVTYNTVDGTATHGVDYNSSSGSVYFLPGEISKPVYIYVNGDPIPEKNETFFVNLTSASNAIIGRGQGRGTIINDDPECVVSMDFDGDCKSDIGLYRDGVWAIRRSSDDVTTVHALGGETDIPVPADYDGDGKTDEATYLNGVWTIKRSSDGVITTAVFGGPQFTPVPADYDGDGKADLAVYASGAWSIMRSSDGLNQVVRHGGPEWIPVPGDYDGDHRADMAVYRNGSWAIIRSSDGGMTVIGHGGPSWEPVPADYDGDGKADIAVYMNGAWSIIPSSGGSVIVVGHGGPAWVPVAADYDGDGRADIAVYNAIGAWSIKRSSDNAIQVVGHGGGPTDVPLN